MEKKTSSRCRIGFKVILVRNIFINKVGLFKVIFCLFFLAILPLKAATLTMTGTVLSASMVTTGDTVEYKLRMQNFTGAKVRLKNVICTLPSDFSYVSGSTSGSTTNDPSIDGDELAWFVNRNIKDTKGRKVVFKAITSLTRGNYPIYATCNGTGFDTTSMGPTAYVQCTGPVLGLSKSVDKSSSEPDDTLTYTINYSNSGDGDATYVFILEDIPDNTDYVSGSASGSSMNIKYSDDNGTSYVSTEPTTVTNLSFQYNGSFSSGGSGSVSFKVEVK